MQVARSDTLRNFNPIRGAVDWIVFGVLLFISVSVAKVLNATRGWLVVATIFPTSATFVFIAAAPGPHRRK